MRVWLFLVVLAGVLAPQVCADQVRLKDGSVLTGSVRERTPTEIVIVTEFGEMRVPRSSVLPDSVQVFLKGGSILKGELIGQTDAQIMLDTRVGTLTLELTRVDRVVRLSTYPPNGVPATPSTETSEAGALGRALLYQSRQKSVTTAVGLELLGAGLIYAEKYDLGIPMVIAENALVITGLLVSNPDAGLRLTLGGLLLKSVNTVLTISAVNSYNRRLAAEMGVGGLSAPEIRLHRGKSLRHGLAADVGPILMLSGRSEHYGYYEELKPSWGGGVRYRVGMRESRFSLSANARVYAVKKEYEWSELSTETLILLYPSGGYRFFLGRGWQWEVGGGVGSALLQYSDPGGCATAELAAFHRSGFQVALRSHLWLGSEWFRRDLGTGSASLAVGWKFGR